MKAFWSSVVQACFRTSCSRSDLPFFGFVFVVSIVFHATVIIAVVIARIIVIVIGIPTIVFLVIIFKIMFRP